MPPPQRVESVQATAAPTISEPAPKGSPSKRKREEPVEAEASARKGKKGKKGKKDVVAPVETPAPVEAVEEPEVPAADEDINMDQVSDAELDDSNSAEEDDEFVHESKKGTSSGEKDRGKKQKKQKYVPEDESKSDRDRRTIFIGNLPVETAKSKVSSSITELNEATDSPCSRSNGNYSHTSAPLSPPPRSNPSDSGASHSPPRPRTSPKAPTQRRTRKKPLDELSGKRNARRSGVRSRRPRMLLGWEGA